MLEGNTYQTIPNWLMKRASLTPNRTAISFLDTSLTFQQLHEMVLMTAEKCAALGFQRGDTVAILSANSLEMVKFIHAMKYIGAKALLLNTHLTSEEIIYQLSNSESKALLIADKSSDLSLELKKKCSLPVYSFDEVNEEQGKSFVWIKEFGLGEVDTIMYTSGTTGKPKGVLQTYGNHWWSAMGSVINLGLRENDNWLCTVPLFHISGLSILLRSVIYGMKVVLHEKFDPVKANRAIQEEGVTIASVVTTMLLKMVGELKGKPYPNHFRCMLLGGGPVPLPLLKECLRLKIPVYQTYGMTETASQIVTLPPEYSLTKAGSAGKALFPCEIRIQSASGSILDINEPGEIVVKGPNVTIGYHRREDAMNELFQDGWLRTGDIGYLDKEGFLYVLDRRSDLIISGGENIYPAELEEVLISHPSVAEAGVTGIKDEKWGQVPYAFIVKKPGADVEEEELKHYCQRYLAKYKIPKRIYLVEKLPRNASNKLLRRQLPNLLTPEGGLLDEH